MKGVFPLSKLMSGIQSYHAVQTEFSKQKILSYNLLKSQNTMLIVH